MRPHIAPRRPVSPVDHERRRLFAYGAALVPALAGFPGASAWAAAYPDKPITLTVPFPPGGSSDTAARIIGKGLSQMLKQSFVIENKAGAAGTIGVAAVVRAAPDGYNLGVGPVGATIIAKLIGMKVPYDPVKDITPIANIGSLPLVFAAKQDLPVKSLQDLLALAKQKPGTLSYGTSGAGTPGHLAFEYFKKLAGIEVLHVPYKGDGPLTADLLGGQVDIGVLTGPAAIGQAKGGRLKFLAATSAKRYPQMPDIPTLVESGYPDFIIEIWNLLIAPARTDAGIVQKLNQAMNQTLSEANTKKTLEEQGYLPAVLMDIAQMKAFVQRDRTLWEKIAQSTGVRITD